MVTEPEFKEFLQTLYRPAQRALHSENIKSMDTIYELGKKKLLDIHGIGPETIRRIEAFTGKTLKD